MAKTLFSKSDLYHLADKLVGMYDKMNIIYKLALAEDNKVMIQAYGGVMWELNLLIESYKLREMTKID
jgi:hypothetical protein